MKIKKTTLRMPMIQESFTVLFRGDAGGVNPPILGMPVKSLNTG